MSSQECRSRAAAIAFAFTVLAAAAAAQEPFPDFGKRFTQYAGNPLLTLESINPWDFGYGSPFSALPGVIHPDVLYFPEGKDGYKFWMVFTPWEGWDPAATCPPPPGEERAECQPWPWLSFVQYWERMTIVRSNDGIHWEKTGLEFRNPVVSPLLFGNTCAGAQGEVHSDPDLVYAENRGPNGEDWFLYYNSSCNPPPAGVERRQIIKLALSEDGIHYTEYPSPVMPVVGGVEMPSDLAGPTVVFDPDANKGQGSFYGWYFYLPPFPGASLGFATSPDGIHWTPAWTPACPGSVPCWENAVISPESAYCETGMSHPDVIKKGDEFWIYYQAEPFPTLPGHQTLYHDFMIRRATSKDGATWTKDERPILEKYNNEWIPSCITANPMPGQWTFWDRTGPASEPSEVTMFYRPSAVVVGNAMYLYFGGLNKTAYHDFKSDRDIGVAFSSRFDDVPPIHWAYSHVEAVAQAGVTVGCGGTNFCPDAVVTRKVAATFVTLASDIPIPPGAHDRNFCDLPNDEYAPFINALYEAGMVEPCGLCGIIDPRALYCPDDPMTRLDLGLFFYKALGLKGEGIPYFDDVPKPYKPLIDRLHDPDVAITAGCAANRYCPDDAATRAMLAVMTSAAFLAP